MPKTGRSLAPGRSLAKMSLVAPHFPLTFSSLLPLPTISDSRLSSCWVLSSLLPVTQIIKLKIQSPLGIHRGLVPGPARIAKSADAQISYIKCPRVQPTLCSHRFSIRGFNQPQMEIQILTKIELQLECSVHFNCGSRKIMLQSLWTNLSATH